MHTHTDDLRVAMADQRSDSASVNAYARTLIDFLTLRGFQFAFLCARVLYAQRGPDIEAKNAEKKKNDENRRHEIFLTMATGLFFILLLTLASIHEMLPTNQRVRKYFCLIFSVQKTKIFI